MTIGKPVNVRTEEIVEKCGKDHFELLLHFVTIDQRETSPTPLQLACKVKAQQILNSLYGEHCEVILEKN